MALEVRDGARFVGAHQGAVAGYIGGQDSCEPARLALRHSGFSLRIGVTEGGFTHMVRRETLPAPSVAVAADGGRGYQPAPPPLRGCLPASWSR